MLRPRDFLLTLSALFLLHAALDIRPRVIRASATDQDHADTMSADVNRRKSNDNIDALMHKVRKTIEQNHQNTLANTQTNFGKHDKQSDYASGQDRNSYNYYANETSSEKSTVANGDHHGQNLQARDSADKSNRHREAQEVKVEFLRSASGELVKSLPSDQQQQQQNTSLYLLSYSPASQVDQGQSGDNEINVDEQQQQPPFTMFPPYSQQQPQQPHQQLLLQQLGGQSLAQENLRQILNNYQRSQSGPNGAAGLDQLLAQDPRLAQLMRSQQQSGAPAGPPNGGNQELLRTLLQPQAGAGSAATPGQPSGGQPSGQQLPHQHHHQQQPQQQQPFSPLQLITAPFHALLPGLSGANNPSAESNQAPANGPRTSAANQAGAPRGATQAQRGQTDARSANGQAQQLPGLFNPFGLQQPPPGGQLANLQALYQQLPIYQALLAARQRQEALQAAEKLRQQHQQQQLAGNLPNNAGAPSRPAYGGFAPGQPGNNAWPTMPQQPAPPVLAQQPFLAQNNQPAPGGQANQGVQQQPQLPVQPVQPQLVSPNSGAVQFDDDDNSANNAQGPAKQNAIANGNAHPEQANHNAAGGGQTNQDGSDQSDDGNNSGNNEHNHDNAGDNNGANNDSGNEQQQQQGGNSGDGKPEEEDPDLKQFQNLANGGDSFTDLFPPGILSNNDINDIKKQQEEQAKRQEEEDRRKQMQQQQQQQQQQQNTEHDNNSAGQQYQQPQLPPLQPQHPQYNQQATQPFMGQPINQFQNNNQQQHNQGGPNVNQDAAGGGGGTEEDENGAGGGNEQPAEDEGNEQDSGGEAENQDGQDGGTENPTAAALTAKAAETSRWTKSPGVVYAKE